MAIDEAILEAAGSGIVAPTLRLYAWQPPCLSLGFAQPASDVSQAALAARGWDLVRRPTGGRAILHTDELTYSVCGSQGEPRLAGGVLESYKKLAQALLRALRLLGMPVEALEKPVPLPAESSATPPAETGQNPVCFEVPSNYEITVGGKKLVGSAQARRKDGVLQHGSLPLYGDLSRIVQGLVFPDEAKRAEAASRLFSRATTAERVLGRPLSWEEAARAFVEAFEGALALKLEASELTEGEQERARQLVEEKYGNPRWTFRV
jgi:lipoate-protein ligase A